MLNPVAMSIIRNTFEDPRERAQAIGIWGAVVGISMSLGPVIGGALVDSVGWRFVFLVNVPIGIAAVALTALYVPESRAPRARRLDPVGQVLVIVALASMVFAIIEGQRDGWTSAPIIGTCALSILCWVGLVRYELRRPQPLIEVRFFRSAPFAGASATAVVAFAGMGGFIFLNTLYLQEVRGFSALHAGLYSLPMALVMLVLAPLSGRIVGTRGARGPLAVSGLLLTAGPLLLVGLSEHTSPGLLIGAYLISGAGMGLVNPPITNTAVSGMPPAQAGVASAIASTSRQVGFALGVAVIGAVTGAGAEQRFGASFASATHPGWWVTSGLGLVVFALAVLSTGAWAQRTATRTAALLAER
jgi:EmrB/QacA subfamily drug resistance transporter